MVKVKLKFWFCVFLVWLAVMFLLLSFLGIDKAIADILGLNIFLLFAAVLSFIFAIIIYCLNLNMLAWFLGARPSFKLVFQSTFIGFFVDHVLPTITPGGEIVTGYLLHKKGKVPYSKAFASVMAQVISWFAGLIFLILVILALLLFSGSISFELCFVIIPLLLLFSLMLVIILYLTTNVKACERIVSSIFGRIGFFFLKILRGKKIKSKKHLKNIVKKTVYSFHRAVKPFLSRKSILMLSCLSLGVHHFLIGMSFYFLLLAFNLSIPIQTAFTLFIIISLASLLSFTPGGIGVHELVSISLLSLQGSLINATLITSTFRLIQYWSLIFLGSFFALSLGFESIDKRLKK